MAYFGENWDDNEFPIAYLITIRSFGTWLHGDKRLSVDTHHDFNVYGAPKRLANHNLLGRMESNMKSSPVKFDGYQRKAIHEAIEEVCNTRGYLLYALNVRTNHAHSVVSAGKKPEPIADAFKAYATRRLRRDRLIAWDCRPWSRGRSRRYLWQEKHVSAAIDYVLYCQGDTGFDDWYATNFDD